MQRTCKKNCGPREGFVTVFLATLSSVNNIIKPAKCVGLGTRTTNAFYTSVWQAQNHGYWNVQSVEQTHVFRNIGVMKLICENERTILKILADKSMCIDLKCPVEEPGLREKQGLLHSWYLTNTLIKMGLSFVSSGMKLNSKSSLVASFTCNSHSFCSGLNSS